MHIQFKQQLMQIVKVKGPAEGEGDFCEYSKRSD